MTYLLVLSESSAQTTRRDRPKSHTLPVASLRRASLNACHHRLAHAILSVDTAPVNTPRSLQTGPRRCIGAPPLPRTSMSVHTPVQLASKKSQDPSVHEFTRANT